MKKVITNSESETINFGKKIASQLCGGEVLCLSGDLGAGKTTLIKGIAKGLGVKKIITSPTFVLMKVYKLKAQGSRLKDLAHIDCYRVDGAEAIRGIGATEYFGQKDTVVVIEWAEKIKKILPKRRMEIRIKVKGENQRQFLVN